MEIYNEQIYDLLDTAANTLQLREDIKRGVFVDGLIEQTVGDAAEAYEVSWNQANTIKSRLEAATCINAGVL